VNVGDAERITARVAFLLKHGVSAKDLSKALSKDGLPKPDVRRVIAAAKRRVKSENVTARVDSPAKAKLEDSTKKGPRGVERGPFAVRAEKLS
jgi:hypothetical protein